MEEGGKRIMLAVHKYVNKTEKRVVGLLGVRNIRAAVTLKKS